MNKREKKRRRIFLSILCLLLCVGVAVAAAFKRQDSKNNDHEVIPGVVEFYEEGKEIAESVHELLKLDSNNTAIISNDPSMDESEIMGEIMGIKISKAYFNFKFDSHKSNPPDCENPKEDAWEALKSQIWRQRFAEVNNLLPTKEEIDRYNTETREGYESSDEGKILIKSFCNGINITEDEYWEFSRRYYAPLAVLHGKVAGYMEEHDITMPDSKDIEAKITDNTYFEKLA